MMMAGWLLVAGLSCSSSSVSEQEVALLVAGRLEGEIEPCG